MQFFGPDDGEWPASAPGGSQTFTMTCDDAGWDPNDEHQDFSAGQHLHRLMRLIKRGHELSLTAKLVAPNILLGGYTNYGPLVQCIITSENATAGADLVLTFKGNMKLPTVRWGEPSIIDFQILPYGKDATVAGNPAPGSSDNYYLQTA